MAAINEQQFKSAGEIPFTGNEIRVAAGFEEATPEPSGGEGFDDVGDDKDD